MSVCVWVSFSNIVEFILPENLSRIKSSKINMISAMLNIFSFFLCVPLFLMFYLFIHTQCRAHTKRERERVSRVQFLWNGSQHLNTFVEFFSLSLYRLYQYTMRLIHSSRYYCVFIFLFFSFFVFCTLQFMEYTANKISSGNYVIWHLCAWCVFIHELNMVGGWLVFTVCTTISP